LASTPFSYHDLLETFAQPGCAVCNLLLRDTDRFIDSLLYEYVTGSHIQNAFRRARGLCNEHSWRLVHYQGGALNIAVLVQVTLDEVLRILKQQPDAASPSWFDWLRRTNGEASALADALEPEVSCMVCDSLANGERHYVETISQYLGDERFQKAYRESDGLCLPHFRRVLRETRLPDDVQRLVGIQTAIWSKLWADLETFKAKYDFNKAGEPMGEEGDSWLRAIARLAGEKGIFGVRR
jgi:hypothetical protein